MDAEPLLAFTVRGTSSADVVLAAQEAMAGRPPLEGPLRLDVLFLRPRPGLYREELPVHGASPAKLAAALESALLGVVLRRGAQFVTARAAKRWGEPRAVVEIFAA